MDSTAQTDHLNIRTPADFNYQECLAVLTRSGQEKLHSVQDGRITKLLNHDGDLILFAITRSPDCLRIEFLNGPPSARGKQAAADYVTEWFDLETDLVPFYELAAGDHVLKEVAEKHRGLRITGMPDLFEALAWAVIGQQINLTFAYTLKKRFVENYGDSLVVGGMTYWAFPSFRKIALLKPEDLRELQFSTRKAEYIINIARELEKGHLVKEELIHQTAQEVEKTLVAIRGIGPWSAHYVMMKCLHFTSAFPLSDVGLHNALKQQLGLGQKPSLTEIERLAENWEGWQAYATFYLWRVLL